MKKKILMADDAKELCLAVCSYLQHLGYETESAGDIESAYTKIVDWEPDLILLDISIDNDETAGIELLRRIRNEGNLVPVVLTSSYMDEDVLAGLWHDKIGENVAGLKKAYGLADLQAAVERALPR